MVPPEINSGPIDIAEGKNAMKFRLAIKWLQETNHTGSISPAKSALAPYPVALFAFGPNHQMLVPED